MGKQRVILLEMTPNSPVPVLELAAFLAESLYLYDQWERSS